MKNIPIFDLQKQYHSLKKEIDAKTIDIYEHSAYINGEECKTFEKNFADYCGVTHAIGVASGTAALTLSLQALELGPGDEVICPSFTFAATAEAIIHVGATPVFVEIDPKTYNINPKAIRKAVTKKTKAIIVVHLYGQMAEMDPIMEVAKENNLFVVEDAAQAHGATYKGKKAGSIGDLGCFSFFPAKNLGCAGDGGGVTTHSDELNEKVRKLKDHGRTSKYVHESIGYGERLDNLQAAILNIKLPYLDKWNQRRREIAKHYSENLSDSFVTPYVHPDCESVFYTYTLRHKKRDEIIEYLKSKGISAGIYYPIPLHLQEAFKEFTTSLPVSEEYSKEIFAIPVYPELTDEQAAVITDTLNAFNSKR